MTANKHLVSLLICLLLVVSAFAQGKSDRELNRLVGAVRSVSAETKVVSKVGNDGRRFGNSISRYDSSGSLVEEVSSFSGSDGIVTRTQSTYARDEIGNRIETYKVSYTTASGKPPVYRGKPTDPPPPWAMPMEPQILSEAFKYDTAGNRREILYYAGRGNDKTLLRRETYAHDLKGNVIELRFYALTNDLDGRLVIENDANGNLIKSEHYDDKGQIRDKSVYSNYKFDPQRNWIERTISSELFKEDGKTASQTIAIEKRTFTYY